MGAREYIIAHPIFMDMVIDVQAEYRKKYRKRLTKKDATRLIAKAFKKNGGLNIHEIIQL